MEAVLASVALVSCVLFVVIAVIAVSGAVMLLRMRSAMSGNSAVADAAIAAAMNPTFTSQQHGMAFVGILTGTDDYGTWPPDPPKKMLASSWSVTDTASAQQAIEGLLGTSATGDALVFDRVRAAHLARAAAGALFIDQDASWSYVRQAGRDLQAGQGSWDEVGDGYIRGKNAWLAQRGIPTDDGTEARVETLRAGIWRAIPFDMYLES